MKDIRQGITPRQAVRTLLIAIVAMLLVPIGAQAADKMVEIFDSQNGVAADVSPEGALEVGDGRGPLTVDGSVTVEPGTQPIRIDGAVEIDEEDQPLEVTGTVATPPTLPEHQFQVMTFHPSSEILFDAPLAALTSISVTNDTENPLRVELYELVKPPPGHDSFCGAAGGLFVIQVQPLSTAHLDFPVPIVSAEETLTCDSFEGPIPARNGFRVDFNGEAGDAYIALVGYHA
jgi:hypothetical protein